MNNEIVYQTCKFHDLEARSALLGCHHIILQYLFSYKFFHFPTGHGTDYLDLDEKNEKRT